MFPWGIQLQEATSPWVLRLPGWPNVGVQRSGHFGTKQASSDKPSGSRAPHGVGSATAAAQPASGSPSPSGPSCFHPSSPQGMMPNEHPTQWHLSVARWKTWSASDLRECLPTLSVSAERCMLSVQANSLSCSASEEMCTIGPLENKTLACLIY